MDKNFIKFMIIAFGIITALQSIEVVFFNHSTIRDYAALAVAIIGLTLMLHEYFGARIKIKG